MNLIELIPQKLKENFPDVDFDISDYKDELTIKFDKKNVVRVCKSLKEDDDLQFNYCSDVTVLDGSEDFS